MVTELRCFLLVVEHGTFTEAARHAHLSQPALSGAIQRLEEDVGARLLERGRTGARLTAAGRALEPHARLVLATLQDGRRAVAEVVGLDAGEVRLGAGPTAATYLLPRALAAFRSAHPGVALFLREAHNPEVWAGLRDGSLDLGVVSARTVPKVSAPFEVEPWIDDPLIIVRGPSVPVDSPFYVSFPRGSMLRELLDQAVPDAQVVMELASIAAVKGNVRASVGKALVSREAVRRDVEEGRLLEVPHPATPLHRSLVMVHRGAENLPPAAAELRRVLLAHRLAPQVAPL